MTIFRHLFAAGALATLLFTAAAAAPVAQYEALDRLEARIVATLEAGIATPGGPMAPIDRRLKLAACSGSPEIAVPTPAAAIVRCTAPAWRIHVPLVRAQRVMDTARESAEPAIRKGEQVDLVASGGGFTVSTVAVADQDGMTGDTIRVRLAPRSAPLSARVVGQGRVAIN